MSTIIKSKYGNSVKIGAHGRQVIVETSGNGDRLVDKDDFLDALKSEGILDGIEIVTELPEVEVAPSSGNLYVGGLAYSDGGGWEDGSRHREAALRSLALARYCEARHAAKVDERKAAESMLAERRDEVAGKIGAWPHYDELVESARCSIDLIIALEDQLAAK